MCVSPGSALLIPAILSVDTCHCRSHVQVLLHSLLLTGDVNVHSRSFPDSPIWPWKASRQPPLQSSSDISARSSGQLVNGHHKHT